MQGETSQPQALPNNNSKKSLYYFLGAIILLVLIFLIYLLLPKKQVQTVMPEQKPAPTLTPIPKTPRVENQIILRFKDGATEDEINNDLMIYNAVIVKRIDAIHRIVIKVPQGQEDVMLNKLKKDNLIQSADADYLNQAYFVPNDTLLPKQWALSNTGQSIQGKTGKAHSDINVEAGWDATR